MPVEDLSGGFGNTGFGYKKSDALPATLNALQEQLVRERRPTTVPMCYVYLSTTQNIVNATIVAVQFNSVRRNYTDGDGFDMWDASVPTSIFIPSEYSTGWWDVAGAWRWNHNAAGRRIMILGVNSATNANYIVWDEQAGAGAAGGVGFTHYVTRRVLLNATDQVRMWVYQDSTVTLAGGRANASAQELWEGSLQVTWAHPDG